MHRIKATLPAVLVIAGLGLGLSACGSAHPAANTAVQSTVSTRRPPATTPVTTPATTPVTTTAASGSSGTIDQSTIDQLNGELGSLDGSAQQATNDINNPQGDS